MTPTISPRVASRFNLDKNLLSEAVRQEKLNEALRETKSGGKKFAILSFDDFMNEETESADEANTDPDIREAKLSEAQRINEGSTELQLEYLYGEEVAPVELKRFAQI